MRFLITAGPTREFFDSVRFISNPSSGKMGYAIAEAARDGGHQVTLVSGPVELKPPRGVKVIRVTTAEEMLLASLEAFAACDVAVMTAAVCDQRPAKRAPLKAKKHAKPFRVTLVPTTDICAKLGSMKGGRLVIGFAMEDHDAHAHAEAKLRRKKCDGIVLNGPSNVAADRATVELLKAGGAWSRPRSGTKAAVAAHLVRWIERLWADRA